MTPRLHRGLWLAVALCAAGALRGADADAVIAPRPRAPDGGSSAPARSGASVTMVGGAFVLAGAGAWLFWRGRGTKTGGRDPRQLTIDETKPLGNRQYLVVASYRDQKFLLGICPGSIQLVAPLPERAVEREKLFS